MSQHGVDGGRCLQRSKHGGALVCVLVYLGCLGLKLLARNDVCTRPFQPSVALECRHAQRLSLLDVPLTADQPCWFWHQSSSSGCRDSRWFTTNGFPFRPSPPVVSPTDGPRAEGGHKPHLWSATDQDQAAGHLLQRLPDPIQLRGTAAVPG